MESGPNDCANSKMHLPTGKETASSEQQWSRYVQEADELLATEFWRRENGWQTAEMCYRKLNRLVPKLERHLTKASFAEYFVKYTSLMARTLKLWRIDPRQPLLKRLLLSWAQSMTNDTDILWQALTTTWSDFKNILHLMRDIGSMPIQLDLLEILSMYFYQMHTRHNADVLFDELGGEFDWLHRRLKALCQNVDMEYRCIISELNLMRSSPRMVVSVCANGASFNGKSIAVKAPLNNGESLGLTVDFNLGVRSISMVCSNRTFHPDVRDDEEWIPFEFHMDEMQSIRILNNINQHILYMRFRDTKDLCNIMCHSLLVQLREESVAEMHKCKVFELLQIQGVERISIRPIESEITAQPDDVQSTVADDDVVGRLPHNEQALVECVSADHLNPSVQHKPQTPRSQRRNNDPFDINEQPFTPTEAGKSKRKKRSSKKAKIPTQHQQQQPPTTSRETEVQIANGSLVSFSYRRRLSVSTSKCIATKEVSIAFTDKRGQQTATTTTKSRTVQQQSGLKRSKQRRDEVAVKTTTLTTTKRNYRKSKSQNNKRKSIADSVDDSEAEEILPVSRRMASKRLQQQAAAANRSETLQDICRNNSTIYSPDIQSIAIPSPEQFANMSVAAQSPIVNDGIDECYANGVATDDYPSLPECNVSFQPLTPIVQDGRRSSAENNLRHLSKSQKRSRIEKANTECLAPMTPVLPKRRRISFSSDPRIVEASPNDSTAASSTSIAPSLPESASSRNREAADSSRSTLQRHESQRVAEKIRSALRCHSQADERQVQNSLDVFQRSLNGLVNANDRNIQHMQHSLHRIDARIVDLERALDRERERFRACMTEAESKHTRFIEDVYALKTRWSQIRSAHHEAPANGTTDGLIRELVSQYGQSVWQMAVEHMSRNMQSFLVHPDGGPPPRSLE